MPKQFMRMVRMVQSPRHITGITMAASASKEPSKLMMAAFIMVTYLMILGWGCLLPFGVAWARYERMNTKKSGGKPSGLRPLLPAIHRLVSPDTWFHLYRDIKETVISGYWCSSHVVWASYRRHWHIAATERILQTMDTTRSTIPEVAVIAAPWEYLHKSMGSIAVICGPINCVFGIVTVQTMGRNTMFLVSLIMFILLFIPVLAYALYKQIRYGKQDPRPVATGRKKSINLPSK